MKKRRTPEYCPVCDADVPANAKACPNCGACHESGWGDEDEDGDGEVDERIADIPEWAYEAEGLKRPKTKPTFNPIWRWVALLLLVALFFGLWMWIAGQWATWVK